MKCIVKGNEPASLIEHRANQPAHYDNLPTKDTRESLITEQGYICCYCMRRIPESGSTPGSKIEHFLCQKKHMSEELNYSNLLLACLGGEGSPKKLQTCDSSKGDIDFTISPSSTARNIETLIKYSANGEIYSDDEVLNTELESVLNLNMKQLKDNRRIVYEEVQNRIRAKVRKHKTKHLQKGFLEAEKKNWLALSNNKYKPFCMVAVYVIDKKLRKLAS